MWEEKTFELGEDKNHIVYYFSIKVEPDCNNVNKFSVNIFYTDPMSFEKKEVVRIDNYHEDYHGQTHKHKLYKRNNPVEKVNVDVWVAWRDLWFNWKVYVNKYKNKKS